MTRKERFRFVIDYFQKHNPSAETELLYDNPFQLLVAVILSAQCTDKRVNMATPALFAELNIAGPESLLKMKGCGLLILNPPWQIDKEIRAVLPALREHLRAESGASAVCDWLVPDK